MFTIYNKYRKYYHTQTHIIVHYDPGMVHLSVNISNHIALISFMILHISDYFKSSPSSINQISTNKCSGEIPI